MFTSLSVLRKGMCGVPRVWRDTKSPIKVKCLSKERDVRPDGQVCQKVTLEQTTEDGIGETTVGYIFSSRVWSRFEVAEELHITQWIVDAMDQLILGDLVLAPKTREEMELEMAKSSDVTMTRSESKCSAAAMTGAKKKKVTDLATVRVLSHSDDVHMSSAMEFMSDADIASGGHFAKGDQIDKALKDPGIIDALFEDDVCRPPTYHIMYCGVMAKLLDEGLVEYREKLFERLWPHECDDCVATVVREWRQGFDEPYTGIPLDSGRIGDVLICPLKLGAKWRSANDIVKANAKGGFYFQSEIIAYEGKTSVVFGFYAEHKIWEEDILKVTVGEWSAKTKKDRTETYEALRGNVYHVTVRFAKIFDDVGHFGFTPGDERADNRPVYRLRHEIIAVRNVWLYSELQHIWKGIKVQKAFERRRAPL